MNKSEELLSLIEDNDIKVGDKVRSFDFDKKDLTGERASYAEGVVVGLERHEGSMRYKIKVSHQVFGAKNVKIDNEFIYPPINGTKTSSGKIMSGVEKI